jgi:all-trans-retinol 13,14-reductase
MTQDEQPTGSALTNYGFAAWVIYGILSSLGYWIAGSLGGLAITLAILAHEYRCHAVKIMDCTAAAFFTFSLVGTIAAGPALFKTYNPVLTWSLFAIVTWVTFAIGFPFTFQYAREQAPREIWDHPVFVRLNVILTLAFGLMFTVNAGLGFIGVTTGHALTIGVIVPILLLVGCLVFSAQYPKRYIQRYAPDWAAAQAASAQQS